MNRDAAIEQAAAKWLALEEEGLSNAQRRAFRRWLAADQRHEAAFHALWESWSRLDRLRGTPAGERLEAELSGPVKARRLPPCASNRRIAPWLFGALAAGLVGSIAYFAWLRPLHTAVPYVQNVATDIGAIRKMILPDGSVLQLNTDSAIEVRFSNAERRIRLSRGEALFTVVRNPARPFVVSAAGVEVFAVGTEFNVRLRAEGLEVIVNEGKVRIDDAGNGESLLAPSANPAAPPILAAGSRVVIPVSASQEPATKSATPTLIPFVEIERSLAWRNRRLVFESASLATMAAEFNRYNRRQLVIADTALAERRFGGTFDATDTRTLVELLQRNYGVGVEERSNEIVLRTGN